MMTQKSYEFTGKTTEEAISAGLDELNVTISDVSIEVLQEGSKGLFGLFGSRYAKIKMTLNQESESSVLAENDKPHSSEKEKKKAPPVTDVPADTPKEKQANKVAAKPAGKKSAPKMEKTSSLEDNAEKAPVQKVEIKPAEQADRSTPAGQAQEYLQKVTALMDVPVSVAVSTDEEGNVKVNMEGDALGILIGRRGETLDALQYLTSLHVNKGKEQYTRVTLDTENYRAKREEALIRLANRMANKATKTGRKVSMEPMNPYERRILHSALQSNPNVETHSEGEEPNRHVVITVNKKALKPKTEKTEVEAEA